MKLLRLLQRWRLISDKRLLEYYPPFWFMGARIRDASPDFRRLVVSLPLRWYGVNLHGTMFGGFMCAVSDPLHALLCAKIFPGTEAWTRAHSVDFRRPARGGVELRIQITEREVGAIGRALAKDGRATHTFECSFWDKRDHPVAQVRNTVFLRRTGAAVQAPKRSQRSSREARAQRKDT